MTFMTVLLYVHMYNYVLVVQGLLQCFEFIAMFGGLEEGRTREEASVEAVNIPFREFSYC